MFRWKFDLISRTALCVTSVGWLLLSGCSGAPDGPQRNSLQGKVTYQGQPVRGGRIVFSPDDKKGNSGPGAIAFIQEGEFETPPGHGVVQGPHVVDILGYNEDVDLSTDAEPKAVVKQTLNIDIPSDGGTYDFEL